MGIGLYNFSLLSPYDYRPSKFPDFVYHCRHNTQNSYIKTE